MKLYTGDEFPALTVDLAGGGTLDIRQSLDAKYNILLFFRGHW